MVIILLLLGTGCGKKQEPTVKPSATNNPPSQTMKTQSVTSADKQNDIPKIQPNQAKLIHDTAQDKELYRYTGCGSYGLCFFTSSTPRYSYLSTYKFEDLSTNKSWTLGKVATTYASGANSVVMNDRYMYEWWGSLDKKGNDINCFIKCDSKTKSLNVIEQNSDASPMVNFAKLSENEFLTSKVEKIGGKEFTVIRKYSTSDDKGNVIIKEENGDSKYITSYCCQDGKIYAFVTEIKSGKSSYKINVYDSDGKFENSIDAQALADLLDSNYVIDFHMVGNYFSVITGNPTKSAVYKIENGKIAVVIPNSEEIEFMLNMQNRCDSKKSPYLFYYYGAENDSTYKDHAKYLFAVETATGKIKKIDVSFDGKRPYLSTASIDEYGNMVLCMASNDNAVSECEYYVSSEIITGLFGKAS